MLLLFFGTDRSSVKDEATSYITKHISVGKTAHMIERGDFEPGKIKDALGATSLFGESEWFVLDEPSTQVDFNNEVIESIASMAESKNFFIVLEGKMLAPAKKQYAKHTKDIFEFNSKSTSDFNPFALAESLAQKDKRRLWVLLQEAKLNGMRDEEIVGILWWQLKTIRLANLTSGAVEAGIKEFSYKKASQALAKFSPQEIDELSQSLLKLYHQGHAGISDMEVGLERWVLRI